MQAYDPMNEKITAAILDILFSKRPLKKSPLVPGKVSASGASMESGPGFKSPLAEQLFRIILLYLLSKSLRETDMAN